MIQEIITNINELRRPCDAVEMNENITGIVQDLKDTLVSKKGLGLSANQIGINKKISYIKVPISISQNKEIQYVEHVLINARIIEKSKVVQVKGESCLSFSGLKVTTLRYVFITVEYMDEKMELQTRLFQDLIGLVIQHEVDHQLGFTLLQRKWVAR